MIVSAISDSPSLPRMDASPAGVSGVSVIIPVHNAATTLEATLNSLVEQTHGVWEAIIVDDGSTDSTRTIANIWAQRDRRLSVLHQDNRGVSAARSEEHTSELQSHSDLVCRLLLVKQKDNHT